MTRHDNDNRDEENIEIDKVVAGDITINVIGDDNPEDASNFNLEKGSMGTGFVLRPDDNVAIVSIGPRVFRDPIPVSTAGFTLTKMKNFSVMVIRTLNANTHIDLLVL